MPEQARVTSLEALQAFRSNLIVYLSQARPLLEEVSASVLRTHLWLENEQRTHWENQIRRRLKELQQAQQALFSAKLGSFSHELSAGQVAVQRAKRSLDESETKLKVVKRWDRDYDGRVQPLVKQMEKMHTVLTMDMVQAVAYLTQAINTLAAYAEVKAPGAGPSTPEAPGTGTGT
ncbi:MAG TPA: hypothetical protein VL361_28840 [Candidatus Limnocylindrales bacterium]|jgi:hypothetical protein|nr:hypothetical protein [Candidatus Limnocylindrales bacterium]